MCDKLHDNLILLRYRRGLSPRRIAVCSFLTAQGDVEIAGYEGLRLEGEIIVSCPEILLIGQTRSVEDAALERHGLSEKRTASDCAQVPPPWSPQLGTALLNMSCLFYLRTAIFAVVRT